MSKMSSGSMNKNIVIVPISFVVAFSFSLKEVHFPYLLMGNGWVISPRPYLHPWVLHCAFSPVLLGRSVTEWLCWVPSIQPGSTHHNILLKSMPVKREKWWDFFSVRSGQGQIETILKKTKDVILCRSFTTLSVSFLRLQFDHSPTCFFSRREKIVNSCEMAV